MSANESTDLPPSLEEQRRQFASELDRFDPEDIIVEGDQFQVSEPAIQRVREQQREQLRERLAEQAGEGVTVEDVLVEVHGDQFTARVDTPTPTATASPTPTATATGTETPTPTAMSTPSPTTSPSPAPAAPATATRTPTPSPVQAPAGSGESLPSGLLLVGGVLSAVTLIGGLVMVRFL